MTIDLTREQNDLGLRRELSEVTNHDYAPKVIAEGIEALRDSTRHTIKRAVDPELKDPREVNCFMHALGLANSTEALVAFAMGHGHPSPDAEFMNFLLRSHGSRKSGFDGDLVVYWAAGVPTHAGRVRGDRVISKWGGGHLWEHRLFEVPVEYGSEPQFYQAVSPELARGRFRAFAQERLGREEFEELFGTRGP